MKYPSTHNWGRDKARKYADGGAAPSSPVP